MKHSVLIFLTLFLVGCAGQKKIVKTTHTKSEIKNSITKKDSSKVVEKSLAINDKMLLSLKTNDKKLDSILRLRLKGFSTTKKSGKNYYSAKFDYEQLALIIASVIGETKDEKINTTKNTENTEKVKEEGAEYFYKKIKVIPWWFWLVFAFIFLPQIISRIQLIVNPLTTFFKK